MAGVQAVVGLMGGGKSYTAIELYAIKAFEEGRLLVTNVPLYPDIIKRDYPQAKLVEIKDLTTYDFDTCPGGAMVILDEIADIWPQGTKADRIPLSQRNFINKSRHRSDDQGRSLDIILLCQDLGDIAAPIRGKCESTAICEKLLDLGMEKRFTRTIYRGVVTGQVGPVSKTLRTDVGAYDEKVYRYYKTHMGSKDGVKPNEARVVKTSMFSSFGWKARIAILIMIPFALYYLVGKSKDDIDKITHKSPHAQIDQPVSASAGQVVKSAPTQPVGPQYSTTWRIQGHVTHVDKSKTGAYILLNTMHMVRYVPDKFCEYKDLEYFCTVDGETVTRFSGGQGAAYVAEGTKPAPQLDKPKPVDLTPVVLQEDMPAIGHS